MLISKGSRSQYADVTKQLKAKICVLQSYLHNKIVQWILKNKVKKIHECYNDLCPSYVHNT